MSANAKLATTNEEFLALNGRSDHGFIQNETDLDRLVSRSDGPLNGLPADAVETFLGTIEFKDGGFAHADYSSLVDHISLKQFHALWAAFGISPILFSHYDNQICRGTAICDNKQWSVCSANC